MAYTPINRTLLINEVAAAETNDFVEFYVAERTMAGGFSLYEDDTLVKQFLSTGAWSSEIASGTYITLHFNGDPASDGVPSSTTATAFDIYTAAAGLDNTDSVLLLKDSGGALIDMVAYADQSTNTLSGSFQGKLVSGKQQGQWNFESSTPTKFDCVNSRGMTQSGRAIARDQFSSKSAAQPSKYDWVYRTDLSPGSVNSSTSASSGLGAAWIADLNGVAISTITPNTNRTLVFNYRVSTAITSNDGYMLTIDIPNGWTQPTLDAGPGHIAISTPALSTATYNVSIAAGISSEIIGRIIVPLGALTGGTTVQVVYGADSYATSPSTAGVYMFTVRDDLTGTNVLDISSSPSLGVGSSGGMGAPQIAVITGPDPTFTLGEVYSFPNPAKKGRRPTIHVEVGIADSVNLRFYDVAGDLVHETELTGTPPVIDDGQGPQYAYEYTWSQNVASGVYIYAMRAKKNGYPDLQKISKLAVIR